MTVDERISSELRRHLPQVDEHGAWDRIQTAATVKRRRRAITLVTVTVAALGLFVGPLVVSDDAPTAAEVSPVQMDVVLQTVAAANSRDENGLRRLFAEDALFSPVEQWGSKAVAEPSLLGAWMENLEAWGLEGDVTQCRSASAGVDCEVRARWHTLSAEAVEEWSFAFDGDRIQTLIIRRVDLDPGDRILPLGLGELDAWEDWLQRSDPVTADRLIPDIETSRLIASFLGYDPALADEIGESIQTYLSQRSSPTPTVVAPGWEQISVTPDLIQLGGRLVAQSVARSENITYVLTGRVQGQQDILFAPEAGLLAAFDDTGAELWRTELDGTPLEVVVVAGDLWVSHGAGTVSRIDSSDGRVLDQVTIGDTGRLVGAFGSVWVETGDPAGLVRVHPSLSTTSVEVPLFRGECDDGDCPHGPTEGAGAIWVPLKNRGVAAIDPDTNQVTVIPVDVIGHEVVSVAVDGDVVYVSSVDQVTSIVDGEVRATVSTGRIRYLGRVEGVFGALETTGRFDVLRATDPMVVEVRETSGLGLSGMAEIDGEAWAATGPYTSRRVEFLPVSEGDTG
ncbi:MAG: PQQ-like beta-propeller repeat protein [Actinomycetota bacterium]|nr:PQQ-like beta-propeller repeat protein [Actinomycetota bacterium]